MKYGGLFALGEAWNATRQEVRRWRYRALKAEMHLADLRMHLHQLGSTESAVRDRARSYLVADALDYQQMSQPDCNPVDVEP